MRRRGSERSASPPALFLGAFLNSQGTARAVKVQSFTPSHRFCVTCFAPEVGGRVDLTTLTRPRIGRRRPPRASGPSAPGCRPLHADVVSAAAPAMPPTTADPLRRDQPAAGPSAEATTSARSKTWAGVVTGFTAADLERVRAFSARRLATRVVGTELHVFVVLPDKASAAVVGRSMGITATWQKADGSSWSTIQSTHDVVVDAARQGKRLREGESQQPLPHPAPIYPDPSTAARARAGLAALLQQIQANDPTAAQDVLQDPLTENIFRDLGPLRATREPMGSPPSRSKPVTPPSSPSLDEEHAEDEPMDDGSEEPKDSAGEPMDDESEEPQVEVMPSLEWLLEHEFPFGEESLVGEQVQLRGLEQRPELNGAIGQIIKMPESPTARVPVSLVGDSQRLLLKPSNVHFVRSGNSKSRGVSGNAPPEDARVDLDYRDWLKRESLLDPQLRKQLDPKPRRSSQRAARFIGVEPNWDYERMDPSEQGCIERDPRTGEVRHIWTREECLEQHQLNDMFMRCMPRAQGDEGVTDWEQMEAESRDLEGAWNDEESGGSEDEHDEVSPQNAPRLEPVVLPPRRWAARPCDTCVRCGKLGHWASQCSELRCGNCKQLGHRAADCPKPAPCFRCGKLGHWVKDCPEDKWRFDERPTFGQESLSPLLQPDEPPQPVRTYLHFCNACEYRTSMLTKGDHSRVHKPAMPRHKVRRGDGWTAWLSDWCGGSGEQPARSELVDEREPDPSDYYVPMRAIDCPSTHGGSVAANSTDLIYRMPHLF